MFSKIQPGQARPPAKRSKADGPEPKKIGFIFTTKITKEKKKKTYNLRALRVLRGVIKLFLPQKAQNLQLRNLIFRRKS